MMEATAIDSWLERFSGAEPAHSWGLSIGGISLHITCDRHHETMMCSHLQPFQVDPQSIFDIQLTVKSAPELPKASSHPVFDSGTTWSLRRSADGLLFDFCDASFGNFPYKRLLVNEAFTRALLQINRNAFRPYEDKLSPLAYPLDELLIMHRLTQERAIELHGTGIVRANGIANLFIGHSGAGKSTTTRLWTSLEEVEVLSDDRIIVRLDKARSDDGRDSMAGPTQIRMYGTPWHGEAMFASPNSAPLTRIFVLEHGHGNKIARLSRSEAVGELFARAFVPFHRHEYLESALSFLEQLVSSVPCYRYSFEPDERAVEKILHFND
ncbi:MAG TPA: hypothetical protein VND65_15810 [Candidatus Binatia bacterium]|nr:hypothetical protein [Candidatus Binatia bacterium]